MVDALGRRVPPLAQPLAGGKPADALVLRRGGRGEPLAGSGPASRAPATAIAGVLPPAGEPLGGELTAAAPLAAS